ncbi:hypothetical protein Tco_0611268 [Tanacetum coccineum]
MMLDSIDNGPLVYPTIEENGQTRIKKYSELTEAQQLQDDCDVQATNIILHSLSPDVYALVNHQEAAKDIWDKVKLLMKDTTLSYQEHECRLYNLFDKFASVQGETFKFVTDVKLAKSLYTTNYDNHELGRWPSEGIRQDDIELNEDDSDSLVMHDQEMQVCASRNIGSRVRLAVGQDFGSSILVPSPEHEHWGGYCYYSCREELNSKVFNDEVWIRWKDDDGGLMVDLDWIQGRYSLDKGIDVEARMLEVLNHACEMFVQSDEGIAVIKIKFDKPASSAASCRTDAIRPRDHDDHQDDAHPEGKNNVKRQKTSE